MKWSILVAGMVTIFAGFGQAEVGIHSMHVLKTINQCIPILGVCSAQRLPQFASAICQ
jgi:hypothetical protein